VGRQFSRYICCQGHSLAYFATFHNNLELFCIKRDTENSLNLLRSGSGQDFLRRLPPPEFGTDKIIHSLVVLTLLGCLRFRFLRQQLSPPRDTSDPASDSGGVADNLRGSPRLTAVSPSVNSQFYNRYAT